MQYSNEECVELLKRLIKANKDRVAGYSEAIQLLNKDVDADLILVFEELIQQSQQFKAQLTPLVYREGDSENEQSSERLLFAETLVEETAQNDGRRASLLQIAAQAEKQLQQIYQEVDVCNEIIDPQIKDLIVSQLTLLDASHTTIVALLQAEQKT